jgi:predicted site-specific integrase-resolvase
MFTLSEVCERYRVSREAALSWVEQGQLIGVDVAPAGSKRRRLRFSEEALRAFEQSRSSAPKSQRMPTRFGKMKAIV